MEEEKHRPKFVLGGVVAFALVATLIVSGVLPGGGYTDAAAGTVAPAHMHPEALSPAKVAFHDAMRKLWEDHITWTRLFIVSFAANLPDLRLTTDRLLQNQVDIGNAIRPFYGKAAAHRLTVLLTEHITTAATLLQTAKDGDTDAFNLAKAAWYANAGRIARFLHKANPDNWSLRDLRTMMRDHLDLTLAEGADRLGGHFKRDIADYDAVHVEILSMADMLSDGIIRQFPDRF
jgi:hypothetical protein